MKPQNFTWKKLTTDELTRVYLDEMRRDFPPSELKPLSMILNSEAAGMAHTWGVFAEDTLVSYLLMVRPAGCEVSQLDYFSVLPAYAARGWAQSCWPLCPPTRRVQKPSSSSRVPRKGGRQGDGRPPSGLLCPLRRS